MEQTNLSQGRQHPARPRRRSTSTDQTKPPISLNPAIFIPITTFPPSSTITTGSRLTTEEHLQVLISNLSLQQETVKQNMIIVATSRVRELRKVAQAELDTLPDSSKREVGLIDKKLAQQIEETLRKLRVRARPGATSEEFELRPTSKTKHAPSPPPKAFRLRENGKIVTAPLEERTAQMIRQETGQKVLDMIEDSIAEIEAYEARSKATIEMYRQRLENERLRLKNPGYGNVTANAGTRRGSSSIASPAAGFSPRGILSNAHEQTPLNRMALDRMDVEEIGRRDSVASPGEKTQKDLEREIEARFLAELETQARLTRDERVRADLKLQVTTLMAQYGKNLGYNS